MAPFSGLLTGNPTSRSGHRLTLGMCLAALSLGVILAADPGRQATPAPPQAPSGPSASIGGSVMAAADGVAPRRLLPPMRPL